MDERGSVYSVPETLKAKHKKKERKKKKTKTGIVLPFRNAEEERPEIYSVVAFVAPKSVIARRLNIHDESCVPSNSTLSWWVVLFSFTKINTFYLYHIRALLICISLFYSN
jgi:hypothetical protein